MGNDTTLLIARSATKADSLSADRISLQSCSWYVQGHDIMPSNHRGRHETSPPSISTLSGKCCRAPDRAVDRLGSKLPGAAGAHHHRLCAWWHSRDRRAL